MEDHAGEIIAIGLGATKWKVGDQAWGFTMACGGKLGTIGEFIPFDTTNAIILSRKEDIKTTDVASIPFIFLTAYSALLYYAELKDPSTGSAQKRILALGGWTGVWPYALQIAAKHYP